MDSFKIRNNKVIYNGIVYDFDKLPENVIFDGNIDLYNINLSKLPNMSTWIVKEWFDCSNNNLTSLKGCPNKVGNDFNCSCNNLTSLEYCPKIVSGRFWCSGNNLTSLRYCPEEVGLNFYCNHNNIELIDSLPEYFNGGFYCYNNPIKSIKEGAMPLKYLIKFYKEDLYNSKELLMKYMGCSSVEEINAYLIMMEKI